MKTRIAIGAAGLLGLAILLETSRYYAGVDRLALWVTMAMGVALFAGLAELYGLGGRLERALTELDGLRRRLEGKPSTPRAGEPEPADDAAAAALNGTSPTLRAWLRARLEGAPSTPPAPVFAPFLTGLLIMLGLLGTFLGLFETLRGASLALIASADVDALRAGLQTPMQGLMRSFGTSACGVATSAALGAALVFTRRTVGRLDQRLQEVASGPLGHLSAERRQLGALEALAAQGNAWPAAAARLQTAIEGMQTAVATGAAEAGKQTATQVRDLFEQAVSQAVAAANAQLREVQAGQLEGLQTLRAGLDAVADAQREQASTLTTQLQAQTTTLIEQERTRAAALIEQFERSLQASKDASAALSDEQRKGAQQASEALAGLSTDLREVAAGVRQQTAASQSAIDGQQDQLTAVCTQLQAAATSAQEATVAQREAALSLARDSDTKLQALLDGSRERVDALLDAMGTQATAQAERQASQEASLLEQHATLTKELTAFAHEQLLRLQTHGDEQRVRQEESLSALADLLAEHLRKLDGRLATSTDLLAQAGGLVQAGGAELVTVAETFSAAVEAQRAAAQAWLESLGEIERSVTDAGEAAAADVLGQHLARTHEVFDRQLRFQQELMEQLRRQGREGLAASPVAVDASA